MAVHKVPQDVEADDKLLGPFTFRQFIYLLIVAALIALAWALFQIFPIFSILPVIPAGFLLILALPLRKDQPMETYIAALISFYTKPNKRFWNPGQRESTITITAPKIVEKQLTKNLTEEEATRRLSFLANVVDSEGHSIKNGFGSLPPTSSPIREEFVTEANNTPDIFENYESAKLFDNLATESSFTHQEAVAQMRNANNIQPIQPLTPPPSPASTPAFNPSLINPATAATPPLSSVVVQPTIPMTEPEVKPPEPPSRAFVELSNNPDYTVATIAKEANRQTTSRRADNKEVYISLH